MIGLLVRKLDAYDALQPHEVETLTDIVLEQRLVPAKSTLIDVGDRPTKSTLLLSGFMARESTLEDGTRKITAVHIPGDFVDLHSLLVRPMDHAVSALTECQVAQVAHTTIRKITETHPHLARLLWLSTLVDGAIHRRWIVVKSMSSGKHMAHLICELYVRLQAAGLAADHTFGLPLTQGTLGEVLGLSVVHVNRRLQQLRHKLIEWQGQELRILDWDQLVEFGEFDPISRNLTREPR